MPTNAEIEIDYISKKVSFNYPFIYKNKNLGYAENGLFVLISLLIVLIVIVILMPATTPNKYIQIYYINLLLFYGYFIWWTLFILAIFYSYYPLSLYLSMICHKYSKKLRENYPKTNAVLKFLKKWKCIDFDNINISKKYYIHDNILVLFDYSIVYFEYKLFTKNRLKKVYTKSAEKPDHKGQHYEFICIFEFEKPINEGFMFYK